MLTTKLVPIARIKITNPRSRNQNVFREIVDSIAAVGLKRPVTVARRPQSRSFDLVCGQGRIEAFVALGQKSIPAVVLDLPQSECMVRSLVENVARRRHSNMELLGEIGALKARGYDLAQIALKTGLSEQYAGDIIYLLERGEQRLINGVEQGIFPLTIAIEIATAKQPDVQDVLKTAYESGALQGRKFMAAKRLVESRRLKGKSTASGPQAGKPMTIDRLIRTYESDAERKRHLIREVQSSDEQLAILAHVIRTLLEDAHFKSLLHAQGLLTLPACLAKRIAPECDDE